MPSWEGIQIKRMYYVSPWDVPPPVWLYFCNQCFSDNSSTSINGEKSELIFTKCVLYDFTFILTMLGTSYTFSHIRAPPCSTLQSYIKGVMPFSLFLGMLKITVSLTKLIQQNSKVFPSHIFPIVCVETALIRDAATGLNSCLPAHS